MTASSTGGTAKSPRTLAYSLQLMAQGFEAGGHPDMAEQVRLSMWTMGKAPLSQSPGDLELVATKCAPTDAWTVLERALQDPSRTDRRKLLLHLVTAADRLVGEGAPMAASAYASVLRHAVTEGPWGCIVHFLLRHGAQFPELRPDATMRRQLLIGHLDLVAQGRDPGPWLQRTLDAMLEQGVEATVEDLDAVLRRHPTALPLWRSRAETMAHTQAALQGIADLRHVLAHGKDPAEQLAFVTLAAAERQLTTADIEGLESLPSQLREGPPGKLARGLVDLRLGRPDSAVSLLEQAAPRADGLHIYALALAWLQSSAPDGATNAAPMFTKLAEDFAKSPHARHASSFARQLTNRREPKPPDPR